MSLFLLPTNLLALVPSAGTAPRVVAAPAAQPVPLPSLRSTFLGAGASLASAHAAFADAVVENPYAKGAQEVASSDDGFDLVGTIVNGGLTLAVLGLVFFIISFAFQAFSTMASTPNQARFEEDEDDDGPRVPEKLSAIGENLFDDSGSGAYTGPITPGKGKRDNMKGAGGREFAPWMQVSARRAPPPRACPLLPPPARRRRRRIARGRTRSPARLLTARTDRACARRRLSLCARASADRPEQD